LRLGTDSKPVTARSFDVFFEKQAREWKIPAEDAARVRSVVDMAIEDVAANANGASGNPRGQRFLRHFGDAVLQGKSACATGRASEEGNGRRAKFC
jgi:hypothetical protein